MVFLSILFKYLTVKLIPTVKLILLMKLMKRLFSLDFCKLFFYMEASKKLLIKLRQSRRNIRRSRQSKKQSRAKSKKTIRNSFCKYFNFTIMYPVNKTIKLVFILLLYIYSILLFIHTRTKLILIYINY